MIIDKILKVLYRILYVNIILDDSICNVVIVSSGNGGDKLIDNKNFLILDGNISKEVVEHIKNFENYTPFIYITILNNSFIQGIMPTTDENKFDQYINPLANKIIKVEEYGCSVYTSLAGIKKYREDLEDLELDSIISPVFLIFKNFETELNKGGVSLSILVQKDSIYLLVIKDKKVISGNTYLSSSEIFQDDLDFLDDTFDKKNFLNKNNVELNSIGSSSINFKDFDFDNSTIDSLGNNEKLGIEIEDGYEVTRSENDYDHLESTMGLSHDDNDEDILFNDNYSQKGKNYDNEMLKIKIFIKKFYLFHKMKFNKILICYTDIYVEEFLKEFEKEIGINPSIVNVTNIKELLFLLVKEEGY